MSKLYFEVFTESEKKDFPKLERFKNLGILVGGTSLALQIKHRRSYDFDVFLSKPFPKTLDRSVKNIFGKITIINKFEEELTFITRSGTKITFFYYPFPRLYRPISTISIKIAHWKDIALDKAYTIGRRAQFRDYIDLFFLIKEKNLSIDWIIKNAKKKFGDLFPEKIFLEQLVYFEDLRIFPIEFLRKEYSREEIKDFFEKLARKYIKIR